MPNRYYRVETETGILKTATENFPTEYIQNSDSVCTLFGPMSPEDFQKAYDAIWPNGPTWKQNHYFTPLENDSNFCAVCGRYFTHDVHTRWETKIKID